MSFTPRALDEMEQEAVASCMRGSCKAMTFDASTRLVLLQSTGHGGQANPDDPAFKPEVLNQVPVAFPYGFLSLAPGGSKIETQLLETASGVLCIAVRCALPAGVPTPAAGDSVQFGSAGAYAHVPASGDTVLEPNSGRVVKAGSDATDFVALAAKVLTELGKIETAYNAHTHADPVSGTTGAPSATYTKASVAATKMKAK